MSRSSAAWWRQDNGKHPWVLKRRPLMATEDEWDETGETWWNWCCYRVTIVMWTWSICHLWCLKLFWCACMLAEVRDVSVVCVVWLDLGNFTRVIRYIYIYNCRIYIYLQLHTQLWSSMFVLSRWGEGWEEHSKIHYVENFATTPSSCDWNSSIHVDKRDIRWQPARTRR